MADVTKTVADLCAKVAADKSSVDVSFLKKAGFSALPAVVAALKPAAEDKKNANLREAAMLVLAAISTTYGQAVTPFAIDTALPLALEKASDATESVRLAAEKAVEAMTAVPSAVPAAAISTLFPILFAGLTTKQKWQTKRVAVTALGKYAETAKVVMTSLLPTVVPEVVEVMGDTRPEVVKAAEEAMTKISACVGNRDIEVTVPAIISSIARPVEVPECVHKLSATTFVQAVEPPALALMVPLLERGLKERATAVKRRACVIIENMCKLVEHPEFAAPFLPKLLPGLDKAQNEISDPECRTVASRAHAQLMKAAGSSATDAKDIAALVAAAQAAHAVDTKAVTAAVKASLTATNCSAAAALAGQETVSAFLVAMASTLIEAKMFEEEQWQEAFGTIVSAMLSAAGAKDSAATAATVAKTLLGKCYSGEGDEGAEQDDEEGEDLCKCEFSLAYGGKILLNNTKLHLKKGKRYAVLGPNGCGKSTLMRAIAAGQVEGFPSPEEVRTAYVEHDIQGDATEMTVLAYAMADPKVFTVPTGAPTDADVRTVLSSMGFTPAMINGQVQELSGGWKMKVSLVRAMMTQPQLLLLDEPTNHLDVTNVTWIVNYLTGLKEVTSLIVSHDSGFLDRVVTDVIHYENYKLKRYKGNLTHFVTKKPEARSYYELEAAAFAFNFPEPGYLEGVNNKGKTILRMTKVGFTYPGSEKAVLREVTLAVSLASRVAVTGANGAGKSTAIKILCGELMTNIGTVWKHPMLRVAYVAQHAFHHIESKLDWTPSEYIQWRWATGEDRESLTKANREITEEEAKKMAEKITINGEKLVVEQILSRRKLKTSYEYEVKWVGCGPDKNLWLPREQLEKMGFGKMVDALDAKEAAQAGLRMKPLTAANIAKHMQDVGLDPEFTLHSRMRGLSGGQKVKVVLGAAMWGNPHLLVLDEPTNYLDRDSLGALAGAINRFGGGVVIISHNAEFTKHITQERWHMEGGYLSISGELGTNATGEKLAAPGEEEDIVDAAGNKIEAKKQLSEKDKKKRLKEKQKAKAACIKRGEEWFTDEEEWADVMGL